MDDSKSITILWIYNLEHGRLKYKGKKVFAQVFFCLNDSSVAWLPIFYAWPFDLFWLIQQYLSAENKKGN